MHKSSENISHHTQRINTARISNITKIKLIKFKSKINNKNDQKTIFFLHI